MSLANTTPAPAGRTYSCRVATLIAADPNPDGAAKNVAKHMANPDNSIRSLAAWLAISENSVYKHRRGYCSCGRTK